MFSITSPYEDASSPSVARISVSSAVSVSKASGLYCGRGGTEAGGLTRTISSGPIGAAGAEAGSGLRQDSGTLRGVGCGLGITAGSAARDSGAGVDTAAGSSVGGATATQFQMASERSGNKASRPKRKPHHQTPRLRQLRPSPAQLQLLLG